MKTGLRGNWSYNTLKKVMQEKTFIHLLEKYEEDDDTKKNNDHILLLIQNPCRSIL